MQYPGLRDELLVMLEQDQREVRELSKIYKRAPKAASTAEARKQFVQNCQKRAERVLRILGTIGEPTKGNIGKDGSQAVSVIALHARLDTMEKVLRLFESSYGKNPESVYHEAIPSLTDMVLIFKHKKQRFGTQWMVGADGKFFLPQVDDFKHMNERRARFGLEKARRPRDLTYGVPKGPPPPEASEADQRQPTREEYEEYVSDRIN